MNNTIKPTESKSFLKFTLQKNIFENMLQSQGPI